MVTMPSDYVGTDQKIDLVGQFDCTVKKIIKSKKSDDNKSKNDIICELEVPNGYHFKEGFMASFTSDTKPDMLIQAVLPYTSHSVCQLVSWT